MEFKSQILQIGAEGPQELDSDENENVILGLIFFPLKCFA